MPVRSAKTSEKANRFGFHHLQKGLEHKGPIILLRSSDCQVNFIESRVLELNLMNELKTFQY